jgi:hypothetical protein
MSTEGAQKSLAVRMAFLCEEVISELHGISSIRRIIAGMSPGGMQLEMNLPCTLTWGVACWYQGPPDRTFRATLDVKSYTDELLSTESYDVVVPEGGEGEISWRIGPLDVCNPGPIWVSISFNGTEVWKRAGYIRQPFTT